MMEPRAESGRIRPGAKNKKGAVCKQGESEASSPTSPPPLLLLLFFLSSPLPPSPRSLSLPACSLLLCRQGGRAGRKRAGGRKGFGVLGVGGGGCLLFCNHPHATHPGEGGGRRRKAVGWGGKRRSCLPPSPQRRLLRCLLLLLPAAKEGLPILQSGARGVLPSSLLSSFALFLLPFFLPGGGGGGAVLLPPPPAFQLLNSVWRKMAAGLLLCPPPPPFNRRMHRASRQGRGKGGREERKKEGRHQRHRRLPQRTAPSHAAQGSLHTYSLPVCKASNLKRRLHRER